MGMKTDLFQSFGHCWVFQICQNIECSNFIASSFRIWNSSTGIPSPPLTLYIVEATWLRIPGCLALGEWSHHRGYLGHEDIFCIVFKAVYNQTLSKTQYGQVVSHIVRSVTVADMCVSANTKQVFRKLEQLYQQISILYEILINTGKHSVKISFSWCNRNGILHNWVVSIEFDLSKSN